MRVVDVKAFYDILADEYDSMTSFEQRLAKEEPLFRSLVEKHKIKIALDAGAGTGVHSLLLAKSGVEVTAVDFSQKMLQLLSIHAQRQKLKIKTVKSDFLDLQKNVHQKFDAIFCMGNSLAHAKPQRELNRILSNFHRLLKPNGFLFIQILNYDRIILKRVIIQSIKESDGKTFIRFYGFADDHIDFNLLTIKRKGGLLEHRIQTTILRPIMQKDILGLLHEIGFKKVKSLGSLAGDKFVRSKSNDLFIVAE
ncbi:MAG: methyltransferase domain-containing protein [Bacteroidota bacterium]|nr:methyltransferase domain-containing protein [Bacteroidota bacterium]